MSGWCGSRIRRSGARRWHQPRRSVRARTADARRHVQARLRAARIHQFDRRRESGTVRQRIYRLQARSYRTRTCSRPGRWAVRSHIKRCATWLGADGNGRAVATTEAERRGISVEKVWSERAAIYPQNRVLDPCEVAQVIAFLCSDAAGGSTARRSRWLSAACGRRSATEVDEAAGYFGTLLVVRVR